MRFCISSLYYIKKNEKSVIFFKIKQRHLYLTIKYLLIKKKRISTDIFTLYRLNSYLYEFSLDL